jgi:hypothetical protein
MARISVPSYFYFMKREILGPVAGQFEYEESKSRHGELKPIDM